MAQSKPNLNDVGFIEKHTQGADRASTFFSLPTMEAGLLAADFDGLDWWKRMGALAKSDDPAVQMKALVEIRKAVRENLQLNGRIASQQARLQGRDEHGNEVTLSLETQQLLNQLKERPSDIYPNGAGPILLPPAPLQPDQPYTPSAEEPAPEDDSWRQHNPDEPVPDEEDDHA